jgi:Putative peptidoglycan binding domain
MKKLILLALALSLPLAQVARADTNNDNNQKRKHRPQPAAAQQGPQPVAQRVAPRQQTPRLQNPLYPPRRVPTATRYVNPETKPVAKRPVTNRAVTNRNVDQGNIRNLNRGQVKPRVAVQGNRSNRQFDRNSFSVARSRMIRQHHDRNWWRSHYNTRFVLFGGGYYYWWDNYWYPAFGYSPIYNNYIYSEPIYGYNDLAPGQVLENVQIALRDLGYYNGPIDGLIGPQTRAALAAFQQDNGLEVTSAVDEPTLITLGLA